MRIVNEERGDCLILSLDGRLDRQAAADVHRRLLVALATHGQPLVCDVGRLQVADALSLTLFRGIGVQATYWPGTPVMLCRADPSTADVLRRLRVDRVVPIHDSLATAMDQSRRRQRPVAGDVLRLPALPAAARAAREFVRGGCRGYSTDAVETAILLVNELVTHSLKRAEGELSVLLSLHGPAIRIAVADDDPRLPHTMAGQLNPEQNLDLRLLNEFTNVWGALPTGVGKLVWCLLED